jgi:dTDP-4-amino-4,6-dideoxygalactose transaminase
MSETRISIPQANPRAGYLAQRAEVDAAVKRAMESGRYILGPEVEAFEREFAAYVGRAGGVGVANGTDAIELALRACDVGQGDIVFTVSHTAVATVSAIDRIGAIPVLVDIDPLTYTMHPEELERAIAFAKSSPALAASRARAVVPVHLYGQPADMVAIGDIARRAGLRIIEDCAQAHGASLHGRQVGTWGDLGAFSLYPTKNLAALGDGGIVVGDDNALTQKVRVLRQYGWEERYISAIRGGNSRLDELQAAVLRVRLTALDEGNAQRRRVARAYDEHLAGSSVQLPRVRTGAQHVYHQYVIRSTERDALSRHLAGQGIGTAIHYPVPVHLQPAYLGNIPIAHSLRHTEAAAKEILSLPMYPELPSEHVDIVCDAIARWSEASPIPA